MLDLKPIKERAAKATTDVLMTRYAHGGARAFVQNGCDRKLVADFYDEENREFYWHARTDVPALVAEVEAERAENQRLRAALDAERAAVAARERKAAAKALREAADWFIEDGATVEHVAPNGTVTTIDVASAVADMLRARADAVERGEA